MVDVPTHSIPAAPPTTAKTHRRVRVRIGGGFVFSQKASPEERKRGVQQSNTALERLSITLATPGVRLPRRRNVPLYSADPENSGLLIRKLNGKTERGVLEGGVFRQGNESGLTRGIFVVGPHTLG